MANTNITPDGSAEYELLSKIMKLMLDLYLKSDDDKRKKLMLKFANQIGDGKKADYKFVSKNHAAKIEKRLQDKDIPYIAVPDIVGEGYMFIVPDTHDYKELFLQIQRDVFIESGDYYAQTTASYIVDMCDRKKENNIYKLNIQDKDAEFIVEQKLAHAKIVCGKSNDRSIYISSDSLFKEKGHDLVSAEIDYAITMAQAQVGKNITQTIGGKTYNLGDIRLLQAECDRNNIDQFIKSFKNEKSVVLGSISEKSSCYLEASNGRLILNVKDDKGKWVENPLDISDKDSPEVIRAAIIQYTENIKDMSIVAKGKWDKFFKNFEDDYAAERASWIVDHSIAEPVLDKDGNIDPKCNYAQGLTAEGNIPNVRAEFEGKQRSIHLKANNNVAQICAIVEKIATKQVVASEGFLGISSEKKYTMKKETMSTIFTAILKGQEPAGLTREELMVIRNLLTDKDTEKLLNAALDNFSNTAQESEMELNISKLPIDKKLKEKLHKETVEKTAEAEITKTEEKEVYE